MRTRLDLKVSNCDNKQFAIYWLVRGRCGAAIGETIPPSHWPEDMRFAYDFVLQFQTKHNNFMSFVSDFGFVFHQRHVAVRCLALLQAAWLQDVKSV